MLGTIRPPTLHSLSSRSSFSPLSLASRSAADRAVCSASKAAFSSASCALARSNSALRLACQQQGRGQEPRQGRAGPGRTQGLTQAAGRWREGRGRHAGSCLSLPPHLLRAALRELLLRRFKLCGCLLHHGLQLGPLFCGLIHSSLELQLGTDKEPQM